jgi:hypothetical protein
MAVLTSSAEVATGERPIAKMIQSRVNEIVQIPFNCFIVVFSFVEVTAGNHPLIYHRFACKGGGET